MGKFSYKFPLKSVTYTVLLRVCGAEVPHITVTSDTRGAESLCLCYMWYWRVVPKITVTCYIESVGRCNPLQFAIASNRLGEEVKNVTKSYKVPEKSVTSGVYIFWANFSLCSILTLKMDLKRNSSTNFGPNPRCATLYALGAQLFVQLHKIGLYQFFQ